MKLRNEERELLELQCRLARLKIKKTRSQAQQQRKTAHNSTLAQLADTAGLAAQNIGWLRLALMPARWRHRRPLLAALSALLWAEQESREKK